MLKDIRFSINHDPDRYCRASNGEAGEAILLKAPPTQVPQGRVGRLGSAKLPLPHLSCCREQLCVCLQLTVRHLLTTHTAQPGTFRSLHGPQSTERPESSRSSLGLTAVPPPHRDMAALCNTLLKFSGKVRKYMMWKMPAWETRRQRATPLAPRWATSAGLLSLFLRT